MTLLEKINYLNLKPRNAPPGIKVSTFGEWLRKLRAPRMKWMTDTDVIGAVPVAYLTLYCDGRLNEDGGIKLGLAEISSKKKEKVKAKVVKKEVKKEQQEIPAKTEQPIKRTLKLKPTGVNTMDPPMTKKLRTLGTDSFWFLYGTINKYKLSEKDQDCVLELEEGTFTINDFETR